MQRQSQSKKDTKQVNDSFIYTENEQFGVVKCVVIVFVFFFAVLKLACTKSQ